MDTPSSSPAPEAPDSPDARGSGESGINVGDLPLPYHLSYAELSALPTRGREHEGASPRSMDLDQPTHQRAAMVGAAAPTPTGAASVLRPAPLPVSPETPPRFKSAPALSAPASFRGLDHLESASPAWAHELRRRSGELLLLAATLTLALVGYHLWVPGLLTSLEQRSLRADLTQSWSAPAQSAPALGAPLAHLSIPSLGAEVVVVEGTGSDQLRHAPGHQTGTALPGALGNAVVLTSRTAPALEGLAELRPGAVIRVEVREGAHTYELTGIQSVASSALGLALPVPGVPGAAPRERLLTLVVADPDEPDTRRLVVFARHTGLTPRI